MLKRYLRSRYDMSPDDYRKRWGRSPRLSDGGPAYAARRGDFANRSASAANCGAEVGGAKSRQEAA
jgi:predicted transcriptional regulator